MELRYPIDVDLLFLFLKKEYSKMFIWPVIKKLEQSANLGCKFRNAFAVFKRFKKIALREDSS